MMVAATLAGTGAGVEAVPDLSGTKGEHALFLVGMLGEYMGRDFGHRGDTVESFYANEHVQAFVFRAYLDSVCADQGIETTIREERRDEVLISWHSPDLTRLINSFYLYRISGHEVIVDRDELPERSGSLSYRLLAHADRGLKLAYLAGAWFRYGQDDHFRFANSVGRTDLVAKLLRDVGCTGVRKHSRSGIPATNTIQFNSTPDLNDWFERLPGKTVDRAIDAYTRPLDSDERSVYEAALQAAEDGLIGDCALQRPFELYRLTFIALDGPASIPGGTGGVVEALADYTQSQDGVDEPEGFARR